MRIKSDAFPIETDWQKYVQLPGGATTANMSAIFVYRIAAFGRDVFFPAHGKKIMLGTTDRSMRQQIDNYIAYMNKTGNRAAFPGTSWHGSGLANDLKAETHDASSFANNFDQFKDSGWKISAQDMYNSHGIGFTVGGKDGKQAEDWHIQPNETVTWGGESSERMWFMDFDDPYLTTSGKRDIILTGTDDTWDGKRLYVCGNDVKWIEEKLGCPKKRSGYAGIYNETVADAVKTFQSQNGLTVDGMVGQQTWVALLGYTGGSTTYVSTPSGSSTSGGNNGSTTPSSTAGASSGGAVLSDKYSETITSREFKSYYTGENGTKSTLYLERVKNLELQEKRTEDLALAKVTRDYNGSGNVVIEDTQPWNDHIDKWETILNTTNPSAGITNSSTLVYPSSTESCYPIQDIAIPREGYLAEIAAQLSTIDMKDSTNYANINNLQCLKSRVSICSADTADPWAGWGRKDILLYLYLLCLEMEAIANKNSISYGTLSVSIARKGEISRAVEERLMEHYCGVAVDIYLPKTGTSAIIEAEDVADILFSMGIKYIGIDTDFVHFDIAGNNGTIWMMNDDPLYVPKIVDLSKTSKITIPTELK